MNIDVKKIAPFMIALAAFCFGSAFVVTKGVLDAIPTFWVLAIRFTGAGIILAIIFHKRLKSITKDYISRSAVIGISLFLTYAFQVSGLNYTTPSKNAFLVVVYCVVVPLLYWAVDKKRPDIYNLVASVLCLSGIGFITLSGDGFSLNIGDILTLIGGCCFAVTIVAVGKFVKDRDLFAMTILQFMFFAICAWIAVFITQPPTPEILANLQVAAPEIAYLIVICSIVAFLCQNYGQRYTPPTNASILISLEAPFAVILSMLLGYDKLTLTMIIGFTLIFISIICGETKFAFLRKNVVEATEIDTLSDN
ncbi:MAG: hypothetical protein BEN19_09055 [Epulopiscium sp. Nuni2H_MBin003]|nr:MAG: hypothetical protein BEN19_09055 [Epulopiscium sp. Nuni2H_MBin003]